ncbi:FAD-binding protein [Leucobacter zeae]|nr:FAD-binding protein [Leucobacter zeae]
MILVVGSGVAGLSCALAAAAVGADVELVTPDRVADRRGLERTGSEHAAGGRFGPAATSGSTPLAQGGIAAAIGAGDDPAQHLADTLAAGGGVADVEAVDALVRDGARLVRGLLDGGFPADREADGTVSLGLEAAHGRPRIVHAGGDRTGAALHDFLLGRVHAEAEAGRIVLGGSTTVESLVVDAGVVVGAVLRRGTGPREIRSADAVVLATGGYAALFPRTSNRRSAVGAGIVLAARAGAAVADLEFVQFHPTVLATDGDPGAGADPAPGMLVSEAVRGAGAVLLDGSGRRFMRNRHPAAELAPRDVVSREIHRVLRERGETAVRLDATGIERAGGRGSLARRFPGIAAGLEARGIDWTREPVPVAPASHYTMGGVLADLDGRSTVPGLFVAGEVAATGAHGANRLASNSLLEGLVFGDRAGRAAARYAVPGGAARSWRTRGRGFHAADAGCEIVPLAARDAPVVPAAASRLEEAVTAGLGIERDARGLAAVAAECARGSDDRAALAAMVGTAALAREESRGAHLRADFPRTDPAQARRRAYRFVAFGSAPEAAAEPAPASAAAPAPASAGVAGGAGAPAHEYAPDGRGA